MRCTYLLGILKWQVHIAGEKPYRTYFAEIWHDKCILLGRGTTYLVGILKWQIHIAGEENGAFLSESVGIFHFRNFCFTLEKVVKGSVVCWCRGLARYTKLFVVNKVWVIPLQCLNSELLACFKKCFYCTLFLYMYTFSDVLHADVCFVFAVL